MSDSSLVDVPFAHIAAEHARAILADRERLLKRTAAWIAVALLHLLFIAGFVIAGRVNVVRFLIPQELTINLTPLPHSAPVPPPLIVPYLVAPQPMAIPAIEAPSVPAPPPMVKSGDALALGRALKCGAGSFENLTPAEQHACIHAPWRFKFDRNGTIVLDAPPPEELHMTPGDIQAHERATADPCPVLQNTPCIHKVIFGEKPW